MINKFVDDTIMPDQMPEIECDKCKYTQETAVCKFYPKGIKDEILFDNKPCKHFEKK